MKNSHLKHILVVDDDEEYRTLIEQFIVKLGYFGESASNGFEGLERVKRHRFDLVLSDIRMEGKDGIQFMKEARQIFPNLEFIIMTGHAGDYSYSDIIAAGATDFITKPFEMGKLKSKLERIEREKQILRELYDAKEQLENIFENAAEAIGIVDKRGRFVKWNKAAESFFGYRFEEMCGRPFSDVYADMDELNAMVAKLRRDGFVYGYEITVRKKDGSTAPGRISIRFLKDSEGKRAGSVAVVTDLTDIKSAMAQLEQANERLREEMAEREKTAEELRKARDELEKLVIERTERLSKAGNLLKSSIDRLKKITEE